ncbi:hypothetical protein CCP3SC5AM1_1070007 [Gammaproteobacteria bacterium]
MNLQLYKNLNFSLSFYAEDALTPAVAESRNFYNRGILRLRFAARRMASYFSTA